MFKWKEKSVRLSTMQMLAAGFLLVIVIGGILLWLPVCNQEPIAFTDALFTSTSAVCVTGLMTVVPAAQFTLLGKVVLLVLIQIGGLGVVAGFLLVIVIGGILLWLPVCNQEPIAFTDALFTSTSAVCVTGLMTVVPATQFTLLGKVVLLVLIQIGGLGVVAVSTFFLVVIGRKITVKERVMIQETYNMESLSGMVKWILRILKGTFVVEGIGAIFFAFQFIPEYGFLKGIWYSVFHSISAFCNAGIDILGADSFAAYARNPLINLTTMILIVAGGIGYTVWFDITDNIRNFRKKGERRRGMFKILTLNSKVALTMTAILIVTGTVSFLFLEVSNPDTLGEFSFGDKVF